MNSIFEQINLLPDLDKAYKGNFYTITGAGGSLEEWRKGYNQMLAQAEVEQPKRWYRFSGRQMNERYGLRGSNAYDDKLTFLAFSLEGLNLGKLAIFKFNNGDRWFRDIVDNNR